MEQENRMSIKGFLEEEFPKEIVLFKQLENLMEVEKLFTNPNIRRKDLADMLGTNKTYLADAIRVGTGGKTFREYIAGLRLKHATCLLSENRYLQVEAIGLDSGFNSRATFFRLFRERFGIPPNEFRNAFLAGKKK